MPMFEQHIYIGLGLGNIVFEQHKRVVNRNAIGNDQYQQYDQTS
jgi:hypothetical protein